MDILVCGAQVPFMRGGAELAVENLVAALERAGHRAELVKLPTVWDREGIFDAALAWRMVPMHADLVIATNFPSYFARHPRKVVWLFHQHRNAYDGYGSAWSDFRDDPPSHEAARQLTQWDQQALGEATKIFTISGVVADRLARFNGLRGEPLYHPAPLHERLHPGDFGDYIFCPSRLESNKRPDLMVEAMAHSTSGVGLAVAGGGSLRAALDERIAELGIGRVELLGFVSDDDLVDRFAGACGVVYVPRDEDYGYVTLQAFRSGKPVITTHDAGGVLEWVVDGENGFIVDPEPAAIADAIDRLVADPERTRRMGEAGRARVEDLNWSSVVDRLTKE